MKKIYIAGAYSADNVMDVLTNMRKGMRLSTEAFLAGFAVFCPWLDHQFVWQLREGETLTIDNFYQYSLTWLSVSDAILLVPGYENSYGTQKELEKAKELGIPVFHTLQQLIDADKAGFVPVRK
jgi:hypothetical protein